MVFGIRIGLSEAIMEQLYYNNEHQDVLITIHFVKKK